MNAITLPAHFAGQQIVLPKDDKDREEWLLLSEQSLAAAYGDDEPEYTAADIKKWNPLYRGPKL